MINTVEHVALVSGLVGSWIVSLIVAQTGAIDPGLVSVIGTAGTAGTGAVLVWYVVYDVRTRTPSMLATFASEQTALRLAFAKEQEETHKHYGNLIEQLRTTFNTEQTAIRQIFAAEQAASRARHDEERKELQNMLYQNMNCMRGAVTDIKNTAQGLINRQTVDEAKKA